MPTIDSVESLVFVMEKEELRIEIGFRFISVFGWLLHFKGHVAKGLILTVYKMSTQNLYSFEYVRLPNAVT